QAVQRAAVQPGGAQIVRGGAPCLAERAEALQKLAHPHRADAFDQAEAYPVLSFAHGPLPGPRDDTMPQKRARVKDSSSRSPLHPPPGSLLLEDIQADIWQECTGNTLYGQAGERSRLRQGAPARVPIDSQGGPALQ